MWYWADSSRAALSIAVPGYRRRLLGLRVEGLRLAGPEQWLARVGKALLQSVPIAQVPATSLQALGTPGARFSLISPAENWTASPRMSFMN